MFDKVFFFFFFLNKQEQQTKNTFERSRRGAVERSSAGFSRNTTGFLVTLCGKVHGSVAVLQRPETNNKQTRSYISTEAAHDTLLETRSKSPCADRPQSSWETLAVTVVQPSFPNARQLVEGSGYFLVNRGDVRVWLTSSSPVLPA